MREVKGDIAKVGAVGVSVRTLEVRVSKSRAEGSSL